MNERHATCAVVRRTVSCDTHLGLERPRCVAEVPLATSYGSSGSVDDRISRPAALVDTAVPETYASYAWIGLSEPAIVGLPIPGFRLTRFHADNGETTPGAYPGLDRFGRVVRQM